MKSLLSFLIVGAVVAAPAFAHAASAFTDSKRVPQQGWSSRVHVYAPNHYVPWYDSYGNDNINPDFQLVR
jgi:Ni/Co efflux regulator RcnB